MRSLLGSEASIVQSASPPTEPGAAAFAWALQLVPRCTVPDICSVLAVGIAVVCPGRRRFPYPGRPGLFRVRRGRLAGDRRRGSPNDRRLRDEQDGAVPDRAYRGIAGRAGGRHRESLNTIGSVRGVARLEGANSATHRFVNSLSSTLGGYRSQWRQGLARRPCSAGRQRTFETLELTISSPGTKIGFPAAIDAS